MGSARKGSSNNNKIRSNKTGEIYQKIYICTSSNNLNRMMLQENIQNDIYSNLLVCLNNIYNSYIFVALHIQIYIIYIYLCVCVCVYRLVFVDF